MRAGQAVAGRADARGLGAAALTQARGVTWPEVVAGGVWEAAGLWTGLEGRARRAG